jgi:catechol 2,3-dioxygenase-like lactoylglutathione lyase family enzyme
MDTIESTRVEKAGAKPEAAGIRVGEPALRGVHHLAIVTEDMRMTCDFYVRVMGMPLVHALTTAPRSSHGKGAPPYPSIPHVFFDMGGDSLLAFFEYPKGKAERNNRDTIAAMQHVSFVCGPKRFHEMLERIKAAGVEIMGGPIRVIEPAVHSFYFFDPNGVRLEIVSNLEGDETDLRLIDTCRQDDDELRGELAKFCSDPEWIEEMIASKVR